MKSPTFAVFRRATVLSSESSASPAASVKIGRALDKRTGDFVEKTLGFLTDQQQSSVLKNPRKALQQPHPDRARVRLDPAIIVDFPIMCVDWRGHEVEVRIGMTAWISLQKAKLWTRFHLTEMISDAETIKEFFAEVERESAALHEFCANYYSNVTKEESDIPQLAPFYSIFIFAISCNNEDLSRTIDDQSELFARPDPGALGATLTNVLSEELEFQLPHLAEGTVRNFNSFVFPLIDPDVMKEQHQSSGDIGASADASEDSYVRDELKCIAVTDTTREKAVMWAVVYEERPLKDHRKSGPFIASAELSLMLGSLY